MTKGCETEVAFDTVYTDGEESEDEEVEDSPTVEKDDISELDDTPNTGDMRDLNKWIYYMLISGTGCFICMTLYIRDKMKYIYVK